MTDTIVSPTETEEEKRGKRHLSALLLRVRADGQGRLSRSDSLDITSSAQFDSSAER